LVNSGNNLSLASHPRGTNYPVIEYDIKGVRGQH
jgi:hypothetical protein